jgi:hypothetical protein
VIQLKNDIINLQPESTQVKSVLQSNTSVLHAKLENPSIQQSVAKLQPQQQNKVQLDKLQSDKAKLQSDTAKLQSDEKYFARSIPALGWWSTPSKKLELPSFICKAFESKEGPCKESGKTTSSFICEESNKPCRKVNEP